MKTTILATLVILALFALLLVLLKFAPIATIIMLLAGCAYLIVKIANIYNE